MIKDSVQNTLMSINLSQIAVFFNFPQLFVCNTLTNLLIF